MTSYTAVTLFAPFQHYPVGQAVLLPSDAAIELIAERKAESYDDPDVIWTVVRITEDHLPFLQGEFWGFSQARADAMIASGCAVRVGDMWASTSTGPLVDNGLGRLSTSYDGAVEFEPTGVLN